jgi:beta-galactosidase
VSETRRRRGADRIWFGAAYYHEYRRPGDTDHQDRLQRDLDLMRDASVSLIRVGESVWSTWEPEPGRFELDWLEPVLDGAAARDIDVILGTPTYAVPPWLARLHPEIAGEIGTGRRLTWGARQEMDFTHPAYLYHAERVIRAVIGRYADHPALVGIQVDNEPGLRLLHNPGIFQRFVDHLRRTYGSVERLNEEWGLVYWSHRLTSWADLWVPDGNLQPQYDLAWRRFQASLVSEFIAWQADVVRDVLGSDSPLFVTTCISYDQVGVADVDLASSLDVASANVYYEMQEGLSHPSDRPMSPGWIVDGTWAVYQLADLAWSSRQEPFLVTETNAGAIGHGFHNRPGYDGQWRQVVWALVSRGARAIEYWHWHTLHYGAETYWTGMLPHDGRPGRVFEELSRVGAELERAGSAVSDLTPDADIAFLYSSDAKWSLGFSPAAPLAGDDGEGDPDSYRRIALAFYRGAFDADLQINTVRPEQLFACDAGVPATDPGEFATRRPVLVAAGYYPARDEDLAWLRDYVMAGGHLIIGPRTAYADDEGRARTGRKPDGLVDLAGVSYQEFETARRPVPVRGTDSASRHGISVSDGATGTEWFDYLEPDHAQVLAEYEDDHLGRWAAVTTAAAGAGRVTTVGTVPGQALAQDIFRWAVKNPVAGWRDKSDDVRVTSARDAEGRTIWFVHHWGPGTVEVKLPSQAVDLLADDSAVLPEGHVVNLGPWDVAVLRRATV